MGRIRGGASGSGLPILYEATLWALALAAIYGMSPEHLDDEQADQVDAFWGLSPRQAAEHLRNQVLADYPDYEQRRQSLPLFPPSHQLPDMSQARCLLIKDIRYENEANFIRAHGGEIWAESELGRGSVFHVVLPGADVMQEESADGRQ